MNVVDLADESSFVSKSEPSQWICWDFLNRRIVPTSYTIRTYGTRAGGTHLQSWVVLGSVDGAHWTELDRQEKNRNLNRPNAIHSFVLPTPIESRCIRIMQTDKNHRGDDVLALSAFELFGTILEE
jgi:hypothetical protein